MPAPTPLTAAAFESHLDRAVDRSAWRRLQVLDVTGSTNDDLKELGWQGERPGRLLVALRQKAGRGTRGRPWHAPAGGLYLSALAALPDPQSHLVGLLAGLAAAAAVEECAGLRVGLKWPNDIVVGDAKLGGVLVEHWSARERQKANLVIGVGLNANLDPDDLPEEIRDQATTLRATLGRDVPLPELATAVANNLAEELRLLRKGEARRLVRMAEDRLVWRNEPVVLQAADREWKGTLLGLSSDGSLRLRDDAGNVSEHWSGRLQRFAGLLLLAACLCLGAQALADILHLDTGAQLEGEVREVDGGYELRTDTGRLFVARDRVRRWEQRLLPEEEYARRRDAAPADDADAQYVLALWCREHDLDEAAARHFANVFRINPDHEEARRSAGYHRVDGAWVSHEEYMKARGYARYRGRWRPREEAERLRREDGRRASILGANRRTRRLLDEVDRLESEEDFRALAGRIAALGGDALSALRQAATDHDDRVRAVAYLALGRLPAPAVVEDLCRRLRHEPRRRLQRGLATILADHPARARVLQELVLRLLDEERRGLRGRYIYALAQVADPAVIPMLIVKAGYTPLRGQATQLDHVMDEQKPAGDGADDEAWAGKAPELDHLPDELRPVERTARPLAEESNHGAVVDPFYPAAEALVALTGRDFGHDAESWEAWWRTAADGFVFAEPDLPEPRRDRELERVVDHLGDGTLRAQMLRRDGAID
ncbi:MAG: biotin--[acetyl-CoA-carboxylase] ligase [Planctomycetota bacterium]